VWGGATVTDAPDTTDPHSGAQAQSIDVTTLGTDGGVIFEQTVTLTAGAVYQASVWLRSPNAATVDFELRNVNRYYEAGAEQRVTLISNWQQYTIRGGFAATTSTFFGINFDSVGTVVVDDGSLRELSNTDCVASMAPIHATHLGMTINKWGNYTLWPSELNFGMLRLWDTGTTWADIEPQPGVWNWTRLDLYVKTAVKNHEAIMLTLGQTPQWASADPDDGASTPPANISDWDTYVQTVATRYKGEIKYWEIWNEVDQSTYDGTPQELATLTQAANQVLKAVDPSNVVLSPNFTTDGLVLMSQFLNDGGGQCIDAMAVHLYPRDSPEDDLPFFVAVQDLTQNAGIGGTPLWNTEGASGDPTEHTDQLASGLLARSYLLQWAWGVASFTWYCWDLAIGSPLSESNYLTPTAAGIAYEQVASWLDGASMLNKSQMSNGTWTIALRASDGSFEYAVWNVNGSTSFAIPAGWTVGSADDLTGGSTPISGSTVTIGIEPLLLVPISTSELALRPSDGSYSYVPPCLALERSGWPMCGLGEMPIPNQANSETPSLIRCPRYPGPISTCSHWAARPGFRSRPVEMSEPGTSPRAA